VHKDERSDIETVCVTGGAGFIGSHLVDAFLASGRRVLVLDDLSSGRRENVQRGAELAVLDIRSRDAAERLERGGIDLLVHHAAQMDVRRSVADPVFDADVNVLGGLNLLEAARRGGVRQVIFASTGGAIYGEQDVFPAAEDHPARPVSPYGVSKLSLERYLYFYHVAHGMAVTCLRYANVYGERQNALGEAGVVAIFLARLLAGQAPTINGSGEQTRDYVHVSDVVQANLAAAGRPGFHIYNVGTGIETSVVELHRLLAQAAGSSLAPVRGPAKPGEQQRSVIDARLIRRELGLPKPLPLAAGVAATAAWFAAAAGASAGAAGAGSAGGAQAVSAAAPELDPAPAAAEPR
jgi:UDP-glucose 4-epimerase